MFDGLTPSGTSLPLFQITSVTLHDLAGCSSSTLAECAQLRFLSLRRCGLRALEGVSRLQQLAYVDVQVDDRRRGQRVPDRLIFLFV